MKALIDKADVKSDDGDGILYMYHLCHPVETVLWKAVPEPPESLVCTAHLLLFLFGFHSFVVCLFTVHVF